MLLPGRLGRMPGPCSSWLTCTPPCLPSNASENFPNSDSGTCLGDSGGPLVVTGHSASGDRQVGRMAAAAAGNGTSHAPPTSLPSPPPPPAPLQIGITSWTGACGAPTAPSEWGCMHDGHCVHAPAWPSGLPVTPTHTPPALPPPPAGVFTDVGEVYPWIAAGVQELTGDELA